MTKRITLLLFVFSLALGVPGCIEEATEHPTKKTSSTGKFPVDEDTGQPTAEPDAVSNFVNPVNLGIPDAGDEEEEEKKEPEPEDTKQPEEDTGPTATDTGCTVFNPNYPDC